MTCLLLKQMLILLDLSAALGTVNDPMLLNKLHSLGSLDSDLSWFFSYLTKHSFSVSYNYLLSEKYTLLPYIL